MSGFYFKPLQRVFLNLSGGTVTGDTIFTEGVYANRLSGDTIYSGGTDLETVIRSLIISDTHTFVQPGTNILTGGTPLIPIISLSDDISLGSVYATRLSGDTIFSAGTNLSTLFIQRVLQSDFNIHTGDTTNPHLVTAAQIGAYTTGQADNLLDTKADLSGDTFTGPVVAPSMSASSLSADAIFSAGTNLYDIFATTGSDTNTFVTGFTYDNSNKLTILLNNGVTYSSVIDSMTGLTVTGALSANTIYSGGTGLEQIIYNIAGSAVGTHTFVQDGINTYTGGTMFRPTVNIVDSPSFNNVLFSGTATGGDLVVNNLSADTMFSAGTNLSQIFALIGEGDVTRVQGGTNIFTGGTDNLPTVNLSDDILLNSVSAVTFSANTMYGDGSNLTGIPNYFATAATLVGDIVYFDRVDQLSAFTLSLSALAPSGGTDFYTTGVTLVGNLLIFDRNDQASAYTVDLSTIVVTGATGSGSGGTIYSAAEPATSFSANTWARTTDDQFFIYSESLGIWIGSNTDRFAGARAKNNQNNIFLRYEDDTPYNINPIRVKGDYVITNVAASGRNADSWNAHILTGTSVTTDSIYNLRLNSQTSKQDNNVNVEVSSGTSIYLYMSGSSVDYPRIDIYMRNK